MAQDLTAPTLSEALREIEALVDRGEYAKVLERIAGLARAEAEPAEAILLHHYHGLALLHGRRPVEALSRFRKSLEAAEAAGDAVGQARAVEQMGSAHHGEKRFAEARAHFERAVKMWAKAGDAEGEARGHRNLGNVLLDLEQGRQAKEEYAEALRGFKALGLTEEMAPAVIQSASLAYQEGGRDAAVEEYRAAVEDDGCRHYLVLNNFGFLRMLQERFEEARSLFEEAEKDSGGRDTSKDDEGLVQMNIGAVEALMDRLDLAEAHFRKAAELLEDYSEARATEILLQANQKYRDQGFHKYLVVDNGLKVALAHLNLATVLAWTGRLEEAAAEARKAVDLDRAAAYPYLVSGWIHLSRDDERAAAEAFRRARGMEPGNEEFRKALNLVNPYLNSPVGRNDPCPCGSGKKFKKCHGNV